MIEPAPDRGSQGTAGDDDARPVTAAGSATRAQQGGAAGNIFDIGYRTYDGPRLGRGAAVRALFSASLGWLFGIGRGGRAKVIPIGLALVAAVPALVALGIAAVAGSLVVPIRYDNYFEIVQSVVILFCAAQAPELVGRDQRYRVLSLYFSRAFGRLDYASAKVAALVAALVLVILMPQVLMLFGRVLYPADPGQGLADQLPAVPAILIGALLTAGLLGSISIAISAFTPRRAYATAAIIAVFLLTQAAASIGGALLEGAPGRVAVLLSPILILRGAITWLFGVAPSGQILVSADLPGILYVGVAVAVSALAVGLVGMRYRRIEA